MGRTKTKKRSKRQIASMIILAMVLETVFVLWPLICALSGSGIAFWSGANENILIALAVGLGYSLVIGLVTGLPDSLALGLGGGLAFGLGFGLGSGLVLSLGTGFFAGLGGDLITGLVLGLGFGLGVSLAVGLVVGLVGGLVGGLVVGLGVGLGGGLVGGLVVGLVVGLVGGLGFGLGRGLGRGLFVGLGFGLVGGLAVGLVAGPGGGLVHGLVVGLGFFSGVSLGMYLMRGFKELFKGARDTFKGFFKPWELEIFSFWNAVAFFFLAYVAVVLLFSLWFYSFYLEGIEELLPGGLAENSFFKTQKLIFPGVSGWWDFVYFSFITITSLGYGDIFPIRFFTQALVVVETVIGIGLVAGWLAIILRVAGEGKTGRRKIDYDEEIDY